VDSRKQLIRLALFGRPVKSSLSPAIHRMFADQFGLEIDYQLIDTGSAAFASALEGFRLAGGTGCNITLPLKRDAWQLAAESSARVIQAQAANTLVYRSTGWFADNTDGVGLMADLAINQGIELAGRRVLILGAGGATAGILGSLLAGNPVKTVLVNRNLERAQALASRFDTLGEIKVAAWTELALQNNFDLLVNATSLGHRGEAPPLLPSMFAEGALCYDLNYHRASQPLRDLCAAMGKRYIDGLGMLVEQAAKSFEIWTGNQPETKAVIEALRSNNH
jgi:shikimate dehydrogenase